MAKALKLVTRSAAVGRHTVNGIQSVLINSDSGDSDATSIAEAVSRVRANYGLTNSAFPANYFDTVTTISDLTSGPLKDDQDLYVFRNDEAPVKVEGP